MAYSNTLVPKSIEKRPIILRSDIVDVNKYASRLAPVYSNTPAGYMYALNGAAMPRMFMVRMPRSAKPRRTSRVSMRLGFETGDACGIGRELHHEPEHPERP